MWPCFFCVLFINVVLTLRPPVDIQHAPKSIETVKKNLVCLQNLLANLSDRNTRVHTLINDMRAQITPRIDEFVEKAQFIICEYLEMDRIAFTLDRAKAALAQQRNLEAPLHDALHNIVMDLEYLREMKYLEDNPASEGIRQCASVRCGVLAHIGDARICFVACCEYFFVCMRVCICMCVCVVRVLALAYPSTQCEFVLTVSPLFLLTKFFSSSHRRAEAGRGSHQRHGGRLFLSVLIITLVLIRAHVRGMGQTTTND